MKDMVQFGLQIRQLRKQNHFTLRELGERSGVSYSFINSIENNRFNPSRETVIALADAFNRADKDELLLLAGFAPTDEESLDAPSGPGVSDIDDPEVSLFFKDFQSAPKERRDEMLRFWHFIKEQQSNRTPDSEQ
ncbi:helix-turn-helix transcriptional regulator [Paenibacillus sp. CGMCC 1.16610]|uniref:Helix-turn-helix domain-containing protein n=1 Tax=Paenibacillus anseongense TaxID=2682845 RepID=A0ABW9U1A2_9BACL|nr:MULTISPECIES: helix-turn-helix transcriptional regulator [Paenibacillus]MBA2943374.1 helix-turn-helix transcriptional regulator [Paenibacillus sp. CGMCC 1.16610]MVQ33872.1 helix-turn-helix domain-containing protein [Paenibacillus anseongense]